MKVLILSCNIGGGHNACAGAIQEQFQFSGDVCDIADTIGLCSKKLSAFFTWGHSTMYRHFPGLFRFGYGFAEKYPGILKDDTPVYKLLTGGAERLCKLIEKEAYDTVVCTHIFSGLLLSETLRRYPMKLKTAFVPTDYTCSPGTAKSNADLYCIPGESLVEEFAAHGVPADKMVVSGIPVRSQFYVQSDKAASKMAIGIDPFHFHILIMCGSMGCGPMEQLVKQVHAELNQECEISVVCGRNQKLQARLQRKFQSAPNVHIYGFTDNINALMDSADVYITKPGGLSTSEAAAKGLPMILLDVVSGCEEHNMSFYTRNGGAISTSGVDSVVECCSILAKEPEKLTKMRNALISQVPGNAAKILCDAMHTPELIKGKASPAA